MKYFLIICFFSLALASCSNTPELETGEIKTLRLLKKAINQSNEKLDFINAKTLITRDQIDKFNIPILFVELETGQNGTLTLYPGKGIGQTWLGSDGATITLLDGILKASRGMGYDLMGSNFTDLSWASIKNDELSYSREMSYLTGNNNLDLITYSCKIQRVHEREKINIWEVEFSVSRFTEVCSNSEATLKNIYFLDDKGIVRKSKQFHSRMHGYVILERLDR